MNAIAIADPTGNWGNEMSQFKRKLLLKMGLVLVTAILLGATSVSSVFLQSQQQQIQELKTSDAVQGNQIAQLQQSGQDREARIRAAESKIDQAAGAVRVLVYIVSAVGLMEVLQLILGFGNIFRKVQEAMVLKSKVRRD